MKKLFICILSLCLILPVLASCNSNEQGNGGDDETSDEVTTVLDPLPEIAVKDPIFLDGQNGDDANDGTADNKAVKTFEAAFALVTADRNRIVISGAVAPKSTASLPECEHAVVLTSKHGDTDYAKSNKASLKIMTSLTFNCDFAFENITLVAGAAGGRLIGNYHNAHIGQGVKVEGSSTKNLSFIGGYLVPDKAINQDKNATAAAFSHKGDLSVIVESGTWNYFTCGNYRVGNNSAVGTFDGKLSLIIAGDAEFTSKGRADDIAANVVSAAGMNISKGSIYLEIRDGKFSCPVFAAARLGEHNNADSSNGMRGTAGLAYKDDTRFEADITIKVYGGDFKNANATEIGALQVPGQTAMHGKLNVQVSGGELGDGITVSAKGMVGKCEANVTAEKANAKFFDTLNGEATGAKKPVRIAVVGDSITFGTKTSAQTVDGYNYIDMNFSTAQQLQKLYGDAAVVGKFGYPGSSIGASASGQTWYKSCSHSLLNEFSPDIVYIALGCNSAPNMPGQQATFKSSYEKAIKDINKIYPEAKFVLSAAIYRWDNPSVDRNKQILDYINPAIKQVANKFDYATYFDAHAAFLPYGTDEYYADKLHPNNKGTEKLAAVFKSGIDAVIGD